MTMNDDKKDLLPTEKSLVTPGDRFFIGALRLVPKNLLSQFIGWLARVRLPVILQTRLNLLFARVFGIDASASEKPIADFPSIEDVFTRKLKVGLRPILGTYVSPADGFLARSAPLKNDAADRVGQLIQAKGVSYGAHDIIFEQGKAPTRATTNSFGWFTTVYLAPHNYHRVHCPLSANLLAVRHIPGELWPVNGPLVRGFPRLFARNERLIFDLKTIDGDDFYVVMVGALNVGRMESLHWPNYFTNTSFHNKVATMKLSTPKPLAAGDELGVFMLGSTVVIILDEKLTQKLQPKEDGGNRPVLMGQCLI